MHGGAHACGITRGITQLQSSREESAAQRAQLATRADGAVDTVAALKAAQSRNEYLVAERYVCAANAFGCAL